MCITNTCKVIIQAVVLPTLTTSIANLDMHDKNWTWTHYLSQRALAQADNVRAQLQRTMERFDVDLVSLSDERKLHVNIRQALVCGFFMQVAHKEGEKGNYLTVKDNQVSLGSCLQPRAADFTRH
jgi:HrpA-like RNA helicase